jgi:hypothetical protein
MKKILFAVPVCFMAFIFSCTKEDVATTTANTDCAGTTPTYTANVKAILDKSCATAGCHAATKPANGIDLSSYAASKTASAKASFLGSINHASGYDAMPIGAAKFDAATIKTLTCWVKNSSPQ